MAPNARPANVEMLKELWTRSLMSYYMMYEQSTKYENYAFWALIGGSALVGVGAANLMKYLPVGDANSKLVSFSKMLIGSVSGSASAFETGKVIIFEKFEKKQKLYNETGARWQKLELNIRLFLNDIDAAHDDDIKRFARECVDERGEICSMSKPEGCIYEKYHSKPDLTIKKYKKKQSVIEHIRRGLERKEEEDKEDGQD